MIDPRPPVPAISFERFVDEHVVARFLQIAPRRVLEMARKKQLPAHPIGKMRKTWRFRMSEIDAHFSVRAEKQSRASIASAVPGTQERNDLLPENSTTENWSSPLI